MEIKEISPEETWPIRQEVMWPGYSLDFVKLENDTQGIHFGAFHSELVAIISIFILNQECQFRKLATREAYQRRGVASALINHIIQYAKSTDVERVWCNARSDKTDFYKRFGLQETNQQFEKEGRHYIIMEKFL